MVYSNGHWLFLFCHNWLNRLLIFFKALHSLVINFIIEVIPLIIDVLNYFSSNNCQLCIRVVGSQILALRTTGYTS
jgi:hypothetical protein